MSTLCDKFNEIKWRIPDENDSKDPPTDTKDPPPTND
jgi:hypothetical protein